MKEKLPVGEKLFGFLVVLLIVACGMGPGLGRYVSAVKPALNIIPDLCLAGMLLVAFFLPRRGREELTPAWAASWLFLGFCLVASVPSISGLGAQGIFGLRAMLWGLIIAMILQSTAWSTQVPILLRRATLLVLLANMVAAIYQAVYGLSAVELQGLIEAGASYQVGTQTRLLGLQATGQELSMLAGSAFVWSAATLITGGFRRGGPLLWALCASAGVVTFVVLQRSALIGTVVAFGTLIVSLGAHSQKNRRAAASGRLATVTGASVLAVGGLTLVAPERVDLALVRLQSLFGLASDYSFSVRQDTTLPTALNLIADEPLGYGLGSSGPVASRYAPNGPLADYPLGGLSADNGYLFVALQIGIVGLAVFVLMLGAWIWKGSFISLDRKERMAPRAVVVFLATIMISGSFWGLTGAMAVIAALASLTPSPSDTLKWDKARPVGAV